MARKTAPKAVQVAKMRALERRIAELNEEANAKCRPHLDAILAISREEKRVSKPLERELQKLQKTLLDPAALIVEHKALQEQFWALQGKKDAKSLNTKRELYSRQHTILEKLKLLGVDVATDELEFWLSARLYGDGGRGDRPRARVSP